MNFGAFIIKRFLVRGEGFWGGEGGVWESEN